jgi:hypothetical protein
MQRYLVRYPRYGHQDSDGDCLGSIVACLHGHSHAAQQTSMRTKVTREKEANFQAKNFCNRTPECVCVKFRAEHGGRGS